MSHRLFGLLALCMALTALTGCGKQSADVASAASFGTSAPVQETAQDSAQETEAVTTSGTFSMPYNGSYGWDPYACKSLENQAVMNLIYQGLFTMNNDFEAEPVLCREYDLSDDGLTYTITLQSAYFSNGKSLEAEDVVYSLSQASSSELYGERFTDIGSYEATSTDTLVIHMNTPNDRLPCLLNFPIIPSQSSTSSGPAGTGPFIRTGEVLQLDNNWWQGASNVQFQTVNLYASASAEDTRDNFEMDNVHFIYNNPMASTAAAFHCDYELWNSKNTVMQYIGFNMTAGLCSSRDIRTAISRAIDRADIAESVYHNFADPTELPVPPTSSMYSSELAKNYQFDAQAALDSLLQNDLFTLPEDDPRRTGGPGAQKLKQETPQTADSTLEDAVPAEDAADPAADETGTQDTTAAAETDAPSYNALNMIVLAGNLSRTTAAKQAADDLADVGFTVAVNVLEESEYYSALEAGNFDLFYADVCLTPALDLRPLVKASGDLNYGRIQEDSTLNSLLSSALENSGNRYDLYQFIMDHGYLCPILFQNNAVFTTRGVFQGLNPTPGNLFYQIENIIVH